MLSIIMYGVGFISGMYVVTQIEKSISHNVKRNKMMKRLDEMDKKKKND